MEPKFTLEKIKFATDPATFERAIEIYEDNKITNFKEYIGAYAAKIKGTNNYSVSIESRDFRLGRCDCYLGQKNYLCKHLVALAIYALLRDQPLEDSYKKTVDTPRSSSRLGELNPAELAEAKKDITSALSYLKSYTGPSRIWFSYQASLSEGCHRLSTIVSKFPVSKHTSDILVKLLLRLSNKLATSVDDSDGTVGEFVRELVVMLQEYAKLDPACKESFKVFKTKETGFSFEDPLLELLV